MRELQKTIRASVGGYYELSQEEQGLLRMAVSVQSRAQAPYSKYAFGVAVLSESGGVYVGCNVERVSYSQTTHAEQNAVDSMIASLGPAKIKIVALVGGPSEKRALLLRNAQEAITAIESVPVPCGHCLQIIWENCFGDPNVRLIALASSGEVVSTTIGDAFPMRFGPKDLGVDYSRNLNSSLKRNDR